MQAGQEPAIKPRPEGTGCGGKSLLIFSTCTGIERSFRVSRSVFLLEIHRLHASALLFYTIR